MGEQVFTKAQYGVESVAGTAVAATRMLLMKSGVPKDRVTQFPEEGIGVRARSMRTAQYQYLADGISLQAEHGYFQALLMLFSLFSTGGVTSVEQNAGEGDYLWAFGPSLSGDNAQDTLTLEVGDDTQAYEIAYLTGKRVKFGGALGKDAAVDLELECFGDQVTPTAFTAGLSLPSVEPMVANMSKIYLDTTWAGRGTTQKTDILRDYSVEGLNGAHPKFHGSQKTMTGRGFSYFDWMVTLTLEGNSNADAIFDAYRSQTPYALRIDIPGSQIGAGDTHLLRFDLWGVFEEVIPLDSEDNGSNLHKAIFHGLYDTTGAAMFDINVTTDQQTL